MFPTLTNKWVVKMEVRPFFFFSNLIGLLCFKILDLGTIQEIQGMYFAYFPWWLVPHSGFFLLAKYHQNTEIKDHFFLLVLRAVGTWGWWLEQQFSVWRFLFLKTSEITLKMPKFEIWMIQPLQSVILSEGTASSVHAALEIFSTSYVSSNPHQVIGGIIFLYQWFY